MADKTHGSGTDTSRDNETAANTPSGKQDANNDAHTAKAAQNGSETVAERQAAQVDTHNRPDPAETQANLGVDYNERVGKFKEEMKQALTDIQEATKAAVHKLDDLG